MYLLSLLNYSFFCFFCRFESGEVVHLRGEVELLEASSLLQTLVDPQPSAFHAGVYFALSVLAGSSAGSVYQALGAGRYGTDASGKVQEAFSALTAVHCKRGDALESGQAQSIAGRVYGLFLEAFGYCLYAYAAGEDQYRVGSFDILAEVLDGQLGKLAVGSQGINCPVNGFKHTTPMSYEMTRRLVKLYSNPLDTVLDIFAGTATCNEAAIMSHRNAIGIELNDEFYEKGLERFSMWDDGVLETDDSPEKMVERFKEQLEIGKVSKENAEKVKEEKKELTKQKKDIRAEIKELETQLKALGLKAKEIKAIKDNSNADNE